MRHFSVAEAEALIPELERIFEGIAELAAQAETKAAALRRRRDAGSNDAAAEAIEHSQLQFLAQRINEQLRTVADLGGLPKGIEPALVDFPHRLAGREVYLCWRLGEKKISHYHETGEGFSERKALFKGSA